MSNKYRAVFLNKKTNQIQLAYKGTDPSHIPDLVADARLMTGTQVFNKRFKDEVQWYRKNLANTDFNVEISGHPLGGSLATHTNQVFKGNTNIKKVTTYNMGHGLFGDMMGGSHDFNSNYFKRQANILQSRDPVGTTITGDTVPTIGNSYIYEHLSKSRGPYAHHGLQNFSNNNYVGNRFEKPPPTLLSTARTKLVNHLDDKYANSVTTAARNAIEVNRKKKILGYNSKMNIVRNEMNPKINQNSNYNPTYYNN